MTCIIIGQAGSYDGVREEGTKWGVKVHKAGTCRHLGALSAHGGRSLL